MPAPKFTYQALSKEQVAAAQAAVTATSAPAAPAALLAAWEADHAAHVALLGADDGVDHAAAIKALEAAIVDARKAAPSK